MGGGNSKVNKDNKKREIIVANSLIENKSEDKESERSYEIEKPFEYELNQELNPYQEKFLKSSYDAIFSCNSIKNLHKNGLNYSISNAFKKRFQDKENPKKFCPLCILGETNKGKTYIINLLTNNKLKSGFEFKTEGLSLKFTDFSFNDEGEIYEETIKSGEEKFLVFDSAGRSEPLLIDPEERKKLKDEDLKRTVESNNRDLKLSETFMKNLLIKNSKIIIVVVNQLSLAEQYFLYELKNDANFEELYVVHNLFNFKDKKDMLDYIDNTIVNSLYFDITKDYYQIDSERENNIDKPFYFVEQQEKNGREQSVITHLILGDIETRDEWIKNFNDKTIDFIKTKMQICYAKDFFFVEKILEDELTYENIIDEKAKLKNEKSNENSEDDWENGKLKMENRRVNYTDNNEAENFEENREFSLIGFTPDYLFYKDEKNKKFVIEVECAGLKDDDMKITGKTIKGKVYFHIQGKKKFPREIKEKDKPFSIYFSVNTEKENIKIDTSEKINNIKPTYELGIYKKVFPMGKAEIITERNDKDGGCNII